MDVTANLATSTHNFLGLRYDTALSDSSFVFAANQAGSIATANSTVYPDTTSWFHLKMWSTVAGTINFALSQNGGAFEATQSISTNIPVVALLPEFQIFTYVSSSKVENIDLWDFKQQQLIR